MAGNNKDQNIFTNLLDVLRNQKGITKTDEQPARASQTFNPQGATTREELQQRFLDWQVQKVANDIYSRTIYFDTDRVSAYQDYRAMDHSPEVRQALNIMRDECLTPNEYGEILQVYSDQERVKEALKDLFINRLNVNYMLKLWIRELLKYGDHFVYLKVDKDQGVVAINNLPAAEIHREEGYDQDLGSVRFRWEGGSNTYFEEWQVAHFRLMEDSERLPYGRSILDAARKTWKQLQLAEDSMLVYRLTRAPDRKVFYIEVGNLDVADIGPYIANMQKAVKKAPIVDSRNGNKEFKYNPQNVTEDYFLPVRGEHHSRIDTLPGACLALDTKICLLDGRKLTLADIIKEHESGKELWSYSINPKTGEMVPGKITWAGVTRKDTQVVKLTLDNGETMVCTPDHKFPTKFNGKKEAKDLLGESLWSFNTKLDIIKGAGKRNRNTYEMVFDHSVNDWKYTHRMVANFFKKRGEHEEVSYLNEYASLDKATIHHKDFNRYNNDPRNLCYMNSKDHFYYHQDHVQEMYEFYGAEVTSEWKQNRRDGLKEYWSNISSDEFENKIRVAKENLSKATPALQELMKDEGFKKTFYEKTSKSLQVTQNTPEFRERQSKNAKKQWQDGNIREAIVAKQKLKYTESMLQSVVSMCKSGLNGAEMLVRINEPGSAFMQEFMSLNVGNKQLAKMKDGFTHNNLNKMVVSFGYKNWRDFTKKVEFFNHKVVSVEWLTDTQDTGTLTIDGQEQYHNYHTFALDCQVFTYNSNMADIQDIEYLENKLFCSLVVPKAYLNFAEGLQGGTTLSQSDIRFARTIIGFQEVVLMELRKIAKVHLYLLGYKEDYENFTLKLNNPSTQMELMKLEIMKARLEVAKEWFSLDAGSFASWTWVMENILSFSKNDIKKMLKQKKVEKKLFAEIDAAPETYKKTGIFRDIDQKYEMAGAPPEGGTGENGGGGDSEGGFNASSALGDDGAGMDAAGGPPDLGGMDAGGGDTGSSAPATAPSGGDQSAPDMALGEGRKLSKEQRKQKLIEMIDELFEDDMEEEAEKLMIQRGKQRIVERSSEVLNTTETLFDTLEQKFGEISIKAQQKRKEMIKDAMFVENDNNPLLKNYNAQTNRLTDLIEQIERSSEPEPLIIPDNAIIEEQNEDEVDE